MYLVARLVEALGAHGRTLSSATPEDVLALGGPALQADELRRALDPRAFVERRNGIGGPAPEVVYGQLEEAQNRLRAHVNAFAQVENALKQAEAALTRPFKT